MLAKIARAPLSLKPLNIFYGWWILAACAALHIYTGGTFFYGFTALFNPIVEEFGWTYALVSLAFSFRGFESGVTAPLIGFAVDKLGPKKLILLGIAITGVGFLLFSYVQALWSFYTIFIVLGIGLSFYSPIVTLSAVARWFKKGTSFAMGLLTAGFGVGGLLVPAVVLLLDGIGWRTTMTIFGIGAFLMAVPLVLVLREPGGKDASSRSSQAKKELYGLTVRETLRTRDFWLLSIAVFFGGVAGLAIIVHQIPYLVSLDMSRATAGVLASILALANVTGRIGFGWLGDHFDKRWAFALAAFLEGVGMLAFALVSGAARFIIPIIALGLGFGGVVPLRGALQVERFGTRAFGSVQGLLMVFITAGSIVAPPFAGWIFDSSGSYRFAFITLALMTFLAVPLAILISRAKSQPAVA